MAEETTTMTGSEVEATAPELIEHFPPWDEARLAISLPITRVTLLEDRAQVLRSGTVSLSGGRTRACVADVAPVLQDVSLRAECTDGATIADVKVRRVQRVRRRERPESVRELEARIESLVRKFDDVADEFGRAEARQRALLEMVERAIEEIPEDAGWGLIEEDAWSRALEELFAKTRDTDDRMMAGFFEQQAIVDEVKRLIRRRQAEDRPDASTVARLEIDLDAKAPGPIEVSVEYAVPNALWRPMHEARLTSSGDAQRLRFSSKAAVWQQTGEDWTDVELQFSTARSSLGTEPPLLRDDLLQATKKSERVVVQARQVAVQRASVGGGSGSPPPASGITLPGVDDGGDLQHIAAEGRFTVPSDGRPNVVPLFSFDAEADADLVAMPELEEKVFVRSRQTHAGARPILAGPVELIREHGFVGWSSVLFVAPGERFELGFGHEDELRILRKKTLEREVDPVDGWHHEDTTLRLFLSNLGAAPRTVTVVERIPVSEVPQVRIAVLEDRTSPMPTIDEHGLCSSVVELEPRGHNRMTLRWRMSTAPGVQSA